MSKKAKSPAAQAKADTWQFLIGPNAPMEKYRNRYSLESYQDGIIAIAEKYPDKLAAIIHTAGIGQDSNSRQYLNTEFGNPAGEANDIPSNVREMLFGIVDSPAPAPEEEPEAEAEDELAE